MSIFWQSVKQAFKELILKWWFICGIFAEYIVALLCGLVGLILVSMKGSAYSYINYNWATYMLGRNFFYPSSPDVRGVTIWFSERSVLFFIALLLAFLFFSASRSSNLEVDRRFKKVLGNIGIVFFVINIIAMLVLAFIFHSVKGKIDYPYGSFISELIYPFTLSGFVFLGALANSNREGFNWKVALRMILLEYLWFFMYMLVLGVSFFVFTDHSRIPGYIISFYSFFMLAFLLFVFAAVLNGETITHSFEKGAHFFAKNFWYALILSAIIFFTKPDFISEYVLRFMRESHLRAVISLRIFPLVNIFLEISTFVVAAYYYREKSNSVGTSTEITSVE